jgi:hypothetical protein
VQEMRGVAVRGMQGVDVWEREGMQPQHGEREGGVGMGSGGRRRWRAAQVIGREKAPAWWGWAAPAWGLGTEESREGDGRNRTNRKVFPLKSGIGG